MTTFDDEKYMRLAYEQAFKGYSEGGCPIGGVLVDNESGKILGAGHNALVQEGNPVIHGEMAAMRAAGRMTNRHNTTMYTTYVENASSDETIHFMRARGIEVIVMDKNTSPAARDCIALCARFKAEKPALWLEDWGGGANQTIGKQLF
ncbi:MAG: cytosine deaminase [Alphaproteobacteria bacterium]|nr:cytosine deaminase [Alphaproteobacteria bacterium]